MDRATKFKRSILSSALVPNGVKSFWFGGGAIDKRSGMESDAFSPWSSIAPIQFYREKVDHQIWRDAVTEMENQIFPFRVQAQQIFLDTTLNAHVSACINKAKNQILLKDFEIMVGETVDVKATELLRTRWFDLLQSYILDAQYYGYSPIALGSMENLTFPKLRIIRRENVSPDRLCISPVIYSPSGLIYFTDPTQTDQNGIRYCDWIIYVDTPNENGESLCGYGMFYKIANLDIYYKNNRSDNATYNEMFGMPFRELKADFSKPADEIAANDRLANSGAAGYMVNPKDSELVFHNEGGGGNGYKSYESFEARLEKGISKLVLGHEDALGSKPGKLGAVSLDVIEALQQTESTNIKFIRNALENQVFPKLANIGFPIKPGSKIVYKNDKEKTEAKVQKAKANSDYIAQVVQLYNAGYKVDANQITEETGFKLSEIEKDVTPFVTDEIRQKIKDIYKDA